jgi:hypothetical protein
VEYSAGVSVVVAAEDGGVVVASTLEAVVVGAEQRFVRVAVLCSALFAWQAAAAVQVLIVAGLGGEPQFEERFAKLTQQIAAASVTATGDAVSVLRLAGDSARREAIDKTFASLSGTLHAGDQFMLVLLGHGSFDGNEYRFNIPGPDMTGSQWLAQLEKLPVIPQLVIVATSASGAIADKWSRPFRAVVTATRVAGERNATRFGEQWANALTSDEADRDKDATVTAAEAYEYANRKVVEAFKADAAIATEHARITGGEPGRFVVARRGAAALYASDSQLLALREIETTIESRLAKVRGQKGQLSREDYYTLLEPVMRELARLDQRMDARMVELGTERAAVKP